MDLLNGLAQLFVVAAVSALAPVLSALIPKIRIPQVVLLILGGIAIGPVGLGIEGSPELTLIANVGLGFVFLLAGFEIDPGILFARSGRLSIITWCISAALAGLTVGGLAAVGFVHAFVPVALALTTTALGTVLPILREHDMLGGSFGRYFLAVGAIGELFPILAIAIFLGVNSRLSALISIFAISAVALVLALGQRMLRAGGSPSSSPRGPTPRDRHRCGSRSCCCSGCSSSPASSGSTSCSEPFSRAPCSVAGRRSTCTRWKESWTHSATGSSSRCSSSAPG